MSGAWTPGPWVAHKMTNLFQIHRHGVRPGYAERIADVIYWSPGHTGPKGNPLLEDASANARLIAAAPDMAEALQAALDISDRYISDAGRSAECQAVYDQCAAALAKARGEAK